MFIISLTRKLILIKLGLIKAQKNATFEFSRLKIKYWLEEKSFSEIFYGEKENYRCTQNISNRTSLISS